MIYYPFILWFVFLSVIFLFVGLNLFIKKEKSSIYKLIWQRKSIYDFAYKVGPLVSTYIPAGKQMDMANTLVYANHPLGLTMEGFIGLQFVIVILAIALGLIITSFGLPSFVILILAGIGYLLPISLLNERARKRQESVRKDLPGMVGLLATSIGAGVELGTSFEVISQTIPNVLGEELRKTMREIDTGSQRARALKGMSQRIGVDILDRFIETINTAEERGGMNISQVLEDFTEDIRIMSDLDLEEKSRKLPTKMLLPIFLCIFTPMLVMILTPVAFSLIETL